MTKAEFLRALAGELSRLPETERREHLDYYSELIDDMMEEDGLSEREAVDRLDDVYAIAADILRGRSGTGEERVLDLTEDSVRLLVLLDRAGAFGS